MARKKRPKIETFDQSARAHGLNYAKAQIKETERMIEPIKIPEGYKKAGEWQKIREEEKNRNE